MPPVGCCTFFTLESTTIWPGAMIAPDSFIVPAQPPTPKASTMTITSPATMWWRIERRASEAGAGPMSRLMASMNSLQMAMILCTNFMILPLRFRARP